MLAFESSGWTPKTKGEWTIQTQRISAQGEVKRPEDPLNSFYAEDLERVQIEYRKGNSGRALIQYLETPEHPNRIDLDNSKHDFVNGLHPELIPHACWPGKYPLVTAQQFAVNAIMRDLANGGIFSVNGPPGTGKTTMLKDILAAIVQKRADSLYNFAKAFDAFPSKMTIERHDYPVWRLHDSLRGFGIVVASANNGAVENISKELPGLSAIDQTVDIDYFSEVADSIGLGKSKKLRKPKSERWGLVSAVLGNQSNRSEFVSRFWNGEYEQKPGEKPHPLRPLTLQDWVAEFGEKVPTWSQARANYKAAKDRADDALAKASSLATKLRASEALQTQISDLHQRISRAHSDLARAEQDFTAANTAFSAAELAHQKTITHHKELSALKTAQQTFNNESTNRSELLNGQPAYTHSQIQALIVVEQNALASTRIDLAAHNMAQLGWFSSLFKKKAAEAWQVRSKELTQAVDAKRQSVIDLEAANVRAEAWAAKFKQVQIRVTTAQSTLQSQQNAVVLLNISPSLTLNEAHQLVVSAKTKCDNCLETVKGTKTKVAKLRQSSQDLKTQLIIAQLSLTENENALRDAGLLDTHHASWHLHELTRDDFHRTSPYRGKYEVFEAQRLLFVAALDLHKAFIVETWPRLKCSLHATCQMLTGRIQLNQIREGSMALWDTLFLVVPLVSTTFASFPRLFRGIGREQLAWVLIDEAGQATPQQAAGAIWRAKRAVIVGDPIQLEPVVGVPNELVEPLRERCSADVRYVPPAASAQTLADRSNRYGTYLRTSDPQIRLWLGSPLVVHRRCLDPMFTIANAIAYDNKMVYGAGDDKLGDDVPLSQWINMPSHGAEGHWIEAQGRRALNLIPELTGNCLYDDEGRLRIYVVTPFKIVAENMVKLLRYKYGHDVAEKMCGTVHTFQGKEADFVVFLLCGDPNKPGAISGFAGKKPNLVNVAVTRAKKRLYVIGNQKYWTGSHDVNRFFARMAVELDRASG